MLPRRSSVNKRQNYAGEAVSSSTESAESAKRLANCKGLSFNARSLLPKMEEIWQLLHDSGAAFLAITESLLDSSVSDREVSIDGYNFVRKDRDRHGSGINIYVRNGINFNVQSDLEKCSLECLFIDIIFPKTKPFVIGACYRLPNDNDFNDKFKGTIELISPGTELLLLGNFNYSFTRNDSTVKRYKSMLSSFSLEQLIKNATRVTATTSSVIDHILTNCKSKISACGVLDYSFSDHQVIFCVRGSIQKSFSPPITKTVRSFANYSVSIFREELRKINWSSVYLAPNVDIALENFSFLFQSAVDRIAPFRRIRIRKDTQPWMTSEILGHIRKRDNLFSKVKADRGNDVLYKKYCVQRNFVQRCIKDAKSSFFERGIRDCGNDSSKLWRQLGSLGHKAKKGENDIALDLNGRTHFDPQTTSSIFNEFYTTVATKLVESLPSPSGIFGYDFCVQFYRKRRVFHPSFSLSPVSRHFIRKQLSSLKVNKSTGLDGISSRFLKDGADAIVDPILHIVNLSISSEVVPSELKKARVKPLYKKGSRLDAGNYRPVSILPVLSKILERAVNDQLNEYLCKKGLLYDFQSGFRKGFSTDTCLMNLNDFIKTETSKGNFTGMVLIDLQKAFDCVDHGLLLQKLSAMGVSSTDWFRSYLSERSQCTQVNSIDSSFSDVTCGVPQGSILGPTLFLCYINDMVDALNCKLSLYADDTALVYSGADPAAVAHFLSDELAICRKWLIDNRLSLHLGKTECILFGSKRRLGPNVKFEIKLDDTVVNRVTSVRYLGVYLDEFLDFSKHVEGLLKKARSKLQFLYRNSRYLNHSTRKLLCQALIFSSLEYCSPSWYNGLSVSLCESLNVFQRKCARFALFLPHRGHIGPKELTSLSWLPFPKRVKYFNLVHTFKVRAGLSPSYLNENFEQISHVHHHNLRQSGFNFSLAHCSSPMGTFNREAICSWNSLPSDLKAIQSLTLFKSRLKNFLLYSD